MSTKDLYTVLPQLVNNQINNATRNLDVNLGGIREVFQDGVEPIGLSELGNSMDSQVKPAPASIRFRKEIINGRMNVILVIEHSGQDDTGHQNNHRLVCDVYRDKDNDGIFEDNEMVGSVDLTVNSTFKDTDTPINQEVRYKVLVKDTVTNLSNWSAPVIIDTSDNLIPYTPDTFSIITQGIRTDNEGNICNAMLKVEKHYDDDLLKLEVYYRPKDGATEWMKQPDIDNNTLVQTESGTDYWIQYLTNLTKGAFYEIYLRAVRKSGNKSDDSAIIAFRAGDFVAPERPRNVVAVNLTQTGSPLIEVHFKRPETAYEDIYRYNIYRYTWSVAGGAFVEDNPTQIGYVTNDPLKEDFVYQDETVVVNAWYVYMVVALDNSDAHNPSSPAFSSQIQATEESDSDLISISFLPSNTNNFPFTIDWTFPATDTHFFIQMRENDNAARRVLWQGFVPSTVFTKTLSLDDFTVQNAKDFMDIVAWQTSDNYAIEIFAANKNAFTGLVSIGAKLGTETFLINPKPPDVTGFTATYDPVTHLIENKWNGTPFYSLSGYEIRLTDLAGYNDIIANPGTSREAIEAKNAIWNAGTVIPTPLATRKNITSWRFAPPVDVRQTDTVSYYFMIKAVGDIFQTYVYRSTEITKAIYSADTAVAVGTVLDLLVAPTVSNTAPYSATLVGNKMNVSWTFADTRQVKEFRLYMSDSASALTTDPPDDSLIVYKGRVTTAIIDQLANGSALSFDKTYYFKIYAVDHYGYLGRPSIVFNNLPAVTQFANLPQPKITGEGFVSAQPFPTSAQTPPPLSQAVIVDVFNSRSVMFEVESFTKDPYSDRIKWYMSVNDAAYTLVKETYFSADLRGVSGIVPKITQSYSSPVDLTLFRIIAVQASPDKAGRLATALPSKYSKIDTEKPSIEITKITYTSATGNNAINKNNYVNKNIIANGLFVSYFAYEKNANSGIKSVEYSVGGGAWKTITTPVLNIPASELGSDTDTSIPPKYRDIPLTLMATDNANNKEVVTVVFRKDTEGPAAPYLPTISPTQFIGKTIRIPWVNPSMPTTNKNIYDGVRIRVSTDLTKPNDDFIGPFDFVPDFSGNPSGSVTMYIYAKDIADNELLLETRTITNVAPKAPTGLTSSASVAACSFKWNKVTQDINNNDKEVRGYAVDYAIASSEPVEGSVLWTSVISETSDTTASVSFTAAQMDAFSADGSLKVYFRVKAIDFWSLSGAYAVEMSATPKTVTAVDMGGNIFKMKLTTNMTNTAQFDSILDANFVDAQYCGFTNSAITDYIRLDFVKAEWMSEIKLKFRHLPQTVKFLFKFEEVSGSTTTDTYMYSKSDSDHTFNDAGDIVLGPSIPSVNRYFEFTTTSSSIYDIARLYDDNFSTGKPIFAKSVTMYLYNATGGSVDIVEFQPVIKSIANVFYGNEVNLDTMLSIRSKTAADAGNYLAIDRYGIRVWKSGIENVVVGRLSDLTYGAWFKDNIYIGGSGIATAPIKIDGSGVMTINSTAASANGTINVTQTTSGTSGNDYTKCFGASSLSNYHSLYTGTSQLPDEYTGSLQYMNFLRWEVKPNSTTYGLGFRGVSLINMAFVPSGSIYNFSEFSSYSGISTEMRVAAGTSDYSSTIFSHITKFNSNSTGSTYLHTSGVSLSSNDEGITGGTSGWVLNVGGTDYAYGPAQDRKSTLSFSVNGIKSLFINASQNVTIGASDLALSSYRLYVNGSTYINGTLYASSFSPSSISTGAITGTSLDLGTTGTISCGKITSPAVADMYGVRNYYRKELELGGYGSESSSIMMYPADYASTIVAGNLNLISYYNGSSSSLITMNHKVSSTTYTTFVCNRYGNISIGGYYQTATTDAASSNYKLFVDSSLDQNLLSAINIKPRGGSNIYSGIFIDNPTSRNYAAIYANNNSTENSCITAINLGAGEGVWGQSATGYGVYGKATGAGTGIRGHSVGSYGGYFSTDVNQGRSLYSAQGTQLGNYVQCDNLGAAVTGTVLVLYNSGYGNQIRPQSSSRRYKEDIKNLTSYSIDKLRPVEFIWKESKEISCGFIAEEMQEVMPDMVILKDGIPESIKYIDIIAILTKEAQLAKKREKVQNKKINELRNELNALKLLLTNLKK